jgi:hypothetical protein
VLRRVKERILPILRSAVDRLRHSRLWLTPGQHPTLDASLNVLVALIAFAGLIYVFAPVLGETLRVARSTDTAQAVGKILRWPGDTLNHAWSWYATIEFAPKDTTPVYPNAALLNPVVAGIGAALLIAAALSQAATAQRRHSQQTDTDRQRRITDTLLKATEQLGSDQLPVRLGGIYTLERLSLESDADYWAIMEILTAFVRVKAPWREDAGLFYTDAWVYQEDELQGANRQPAADISAVLTVIGRRKGIELKTLERPGWAINLSNCDLRGVNLFGMNFENIYLIGAHLERANLRSTSLRYAQCRNTHFGGARFRDTQLNRTHFEGAHLEEAKELTQAQLDQAQGDEKTSLPSGLIRPDHWSHKNPNG